MYIVMELQQAKCRELCYDAGGGVNGSDGTERLLRGVAWKEAQRGNWELDGLNQMIIFILSIAIYHCFNVDVSLLLQARRQAPYK